MIPNDEILVKESLQAVWTKMEYEGYMGACSGRTTSSHPIAFAGPCRLPATDMYFTMETFSGASLTTRRGSF